MKLNFYAICALGLVRPQNQDNLYINGVFRKDVADQSVFKHDGDILKRGLFAVADGMGGEKHGELASLIAVQAMDTINLSDDGQSIADYLIERNAAICDLIKKNNGVRIGSTFAGLNINENKADIVNIGDSRIYLLRDEEISQLSRDHTSVQQMIDLNILTKEAARSDPNRHKLTQHLGILPSEMLIEPYVTQTVIQENDIFLLCSDGLTDMLDDSAIEAVLKSNGKLDEKAEILYSDALQKGGKDNITIILVQVVKRRLFK